MSADTIASRLQRVRERAKAHTGKAPASPLAIHRAIVDAIGGQELDGAMSRNLRAIVHKDEVARLSLAGMRVSEIATELGLSYGHVCKLRAELGVSRQR